MKIYWYWPFARPEELPLACETAGPDDDVVVHVIDREGAPVGSPCDSVTVIRDLPDVRRGMNRSPGWVASRVVTYGRRAIERDRAIARFQPDVCHLHYLNRFTDWLLPRASGRPLVFSVHDVAPHDRRLPSRLERRLLTATYRRADAVVVHHEYLRRRLVAEFGVDERCAHVVPHQVFAYEDAEPVSLPAEPRVLFFGALRHNKGVGVLLDAIAHTETDIRFTIAGRGEAEVEASVRRAAAADGRLQIEIGYVSQQRKIELFRQASVVVLPYTAFESQSGVLHDAYAHGRPVVVADVGALGDSVIEDGTGVVVPPSDPQALLRSIEALVMDEDALRGYAENATALRATRSPEKVGRVLRTVYDAVV